MIFRTATRPDLPAVVAPLAGEATVVDPRTVHVDDAHVRAFDAIAMT
ncbi:hypothetical protein [Streptomyces xantholiticus]|uniref:Acetyltransferase n=1 Tax=Streptomyces xantholiticus TaxID=68285 RepID=A0ABV1V5X4_9ACTN